MAQLEVPLELRELQSNDARVVEAAKKRFHEFFNSTKESFLVNGVVDWFVSSGCPRCVDLLVAVREPHDLHFFNKVAEGLRSSSSSCRLSVITLLSHVIMRQPTWVHKMTQHGVFKELLKLLKSENDIVILVSALLTLVILLPIIPAYFGSSLNEIFEVFSRIAAWNAQSPHKQQSDEIVHLQITLHHLFYRLYGMFPCNFLSYLRQQYGARENLTIFSHTIKPMLDSVKMHPLLVTTSKETETTTIRWKTMEHHDVVVECAKLSVDAKDETAPAALVTFRARSESEIRRVMEASGYQDLRGVTSQVAEARDLWGMSSNETSVPVTPLPVEATAPTSIPLTPVAQAHVVNSSFPHEIGTSPPEAAVEATPETTPVKDPRVLRSHPTVVNPAVVRALPRWGATTTPTPTNSQPSSPMKKEYSPFRFPDKGSESLYGEAVQRKLAMIVQDRNAAQMDNATQRGAVNGAKTGEEVATSAMGCDRLQEDPLDQEVLLINQHGDLSINHLSSSRECDSVLQDFHTPHEEDDEPCELESGSPCPEGGLHMANSASLYNFRQVQNRLRMRYYSQCGAVLGGSEPSSEGVGIGSSNTVRRAFSCPEMKKERPSFTAPDDSSLLDESQELDPPTVVPATATAETQTNEELPMYPYDHLLLALMPPSTAPAHNSDAHRPASPSTLLDQYLDLAAAQRQSDSHKTVRDQLTLMHLQLKFERHRRDSHAERNRRLLGKARANRQLDEYNSALRDQLGILNRDLDALRGDICRMKEERAKSERLQQDEVEMWRDQCANLDKQNRELKSENQRLFLQLQNNQQDVTATTKKLQQIQAQYFEVGRELHEAQKKASAGEVLKTQVARLQRELLIMGEVTNRARIQLERLSMRSDKAMQLSHDAYQDQVRNLSSQLENKSSSCEMLKTRVAELEVALARRDAHLIELKRTLKAAKEECSERLQAVETKYKSEVAINRKLECHVFELTSKLELCSRRSRRNVSAAQDALSVAERSGVNSPLSLSLSSSEGLSLSSTLTTDAVPTRDLQAVLDAPEVSAIPEMPEFDDLPGQSHAADAEKS